MNVVALSTSTTTATPPRNAPGGIRPGSKWTKTSGHAEPAIPTPFLARTLVLHGKPIMACPPAAWGDPSVVGAGCPNGFCRGCGSLGGERRAIILGRHRTKPGRDTIRILG